jgi:hypothetical protein
MVPTQLPVRSKAWAEDTAEDSKTTERVNDVQIDTCIRGPPLFERVGNRGEMLGASAILGESRRRRQPPDRPQDEWC